MNTFLFTQIINTVLGLLIVCGLVSLIKITRIGCCDIMEACVYE